MDVPGKSTLVLFFSEGCGHCRNMMPAWNQASNALLQSGQFDVLAFEETKDNSKIKQFGTGIRGFPAIRLYPEGFPSNTFIDYKGDRSADSFMKFVQSNGTQT